MKKRYNEPTLQFCVQVRLPETQDVIERFTIEQNRGPRNDVHRVNGVYNSVQSHLHELAERNHLDYEIVWFGDVKDRSRWIAGESIDP